MPTLAEVVGRLIEEHGADAAREIAPLVDATVRKAYAKGGDDRERVVLAGLKAVAHLNGSASKVLKSHPFDESEHNRDHGKFAAKEGADANPEPTPTPAPATRFHHEVTHDEIKRRAGSLRGAVNAVRREEMTPEEFESHVANWHEKTANHVRNRYKQAWQQIGAKLWEDFPEGMRAAMGGQPLPGWGELHDALSAARDKGVAGVETLADFTRDFARTGTRDDADWFEKQLGDIRIELDEAHNPVYAALKTVRDHLAGDRKGEFKLGRYLKAWNEDDHPRGDDGKFIAGEDLSAAKGDPAKAKELRSQVTDPEERKKLEAAIGGKKVNAGANAALLAASKKQQGEAPKAPAPDLRPNPDLDELFAEPPQAPPAGGDLRHNPDADELFGDDLPEPPGGDVTDDVQSAPLSSASTDLAAQADGHRLDRARTFTPSEGTPSDLKRADGLGIGPHEIEAAKGRKGTAPFDAQMLRAKVRGQDAYKLEQALGTHDVLAKPAKTLRAADQQAKAHLMLAHAAEKAGDAELAKKHREAMRTLFLAAKHFEDAKDGDTAAGVKAKAAVAAAEKLFPAAKKPAKPRKKKSESATSPTS